MRMVNLLKQTENSKTFKWGLMATILLTTLFAGYLCNKGLPLAEGWYDYYASQILDGEVVYKDFEFLFTPIYIYFMTFFIKIVGNDILCMRILGVVMFVIIAILLFCIMSRIFTVSASFFGATTAVFYLQSEVYSVFYDYVRLMDIAALLSILFMTSAVIKWSKQNKATVDLILWGIFTSVFILIKQNMGLLFAVFSVIFLVATLMYLKQTLGHIIKLLTIYVITVLIPIIVTFLVISITSDLNLFLNSVFLGAAEAKGGISTVLFRWIITGKDSFLLYFMSAAVAVLILIINYRISLSVRLDNVKSSIIITILGFFIFLISLLVVMYNSQIGSYFSMRKSVDAYFIFLIAFLLMLILIVVFLIDLIKKKTTYIKYLPLLGILGAFFSISYGAGTSGGLSVGESALGVAAIICLFMDSLKNHWGVGLRAIIISFCIFISMRNIGAKLILPCQWWGINSGSIYECTEQTTIDGLSGIYMTPTEKNLYENVVETIKQYSKEDESIYCFPCIPIFYCLTDRKDPGVFSKVQWFDVSTNESVIADINILKSNPPKVIVILNLDEATYDGHESAFNSGEQWYTYNERFSIQFCLYKSI